VKKIILVLLVLFLMSPVLAQSVFACGPDCGGTTVPQPSLIIEFAPVFANVGTHANATVGNYFTVFNEPFNIGPPASGRIDTNTGIYTPPYTPPPPPPPYFFYNDLNYWIKTQTGVFDANVNPPMNQMVIQLEGSNTQFPNLPGQGGMFDIINDGLQYAANQPAPGGQEYYQTQVRIGAYDIPFPSEPTVLTNSRLQSHTLTNTLVYDPSTETLTTGWGNVSEDGNGPPTVNSFFDADGLDVWFDFRGSSYAWGATEDQGVRIVTFFNGDFPLASGTNGGGCENIPEPTTMLLLGSGLLGLAGLRRKFKK